MVYLHVGFAVIVTVLSTFISFSPFSFSFPLQYLKVSLKEMEEASSSTILEGEITGIKFGLATHQEIVSRNLTFNSLVIQLISSTV